MNQTCNMFRFLVRSSGCSVYSPYCKSLGLLRFSSSDAVPEKPLTLPSSVVSEKNFDPRLHQIVDQVEKLTLLEVSELNQLLKKRLNIPDTPIMAMGAMPATSVGPPSADTEESDEPKAVKSSYTVKLTKYDEGKKVGLIKEIKGLVGGLNLVQAKKFVESVPQVVKTDLTKEEAEKLKAQLESLGATIVLD